MQPLMRNVYDLRVITAIEPGEGSVLLTFQGGERATVPTDHPDLKLILAEAERSSEWGSPVGLILDPAGRVLDLSHTHESCVRRIEDDSEGPNRLAVGFWSFCAVCYLTRDHPDFERIRKTLTEAVATDKPVVFANETWPLEGETEIWNKIMDVRPVEVPGRLPQANGAAVTHDSTPRAATAAERGG